MRDLLTIPLLALACGTCSAQLNISQLGHLDYHALRNSDLSNIWGYTDELGNEYALVGVDGDPNVQGTGGLSVVNVSDPANPVEVFFTPGPNSIWREIKVWGDHAYMTTEAEQGLTIVDLSPLPQSATLPVTVFQGSDWTTAHSLFIDENGRLYLNGSDRAPGGVIMYDLTQDPEAPVEVGEYEAYYVHDCFARGDTLYAAHIFDGFFTIVDVSDPANPDLLGAATTPNNFTHNCWLDGSGHYLFTTDERPNSYLASYDVSDPSDIQQLDQLQTDPGSQAIIHNTYWLNGYVVQSYYTEGVSIYDVTQPDNVVEVGQYDTSPLTGSGFNGAWGVYPFAPSGNLFVSDIEGGLYVLHPTYVQACRLEGSITNASTSAPINLAVVTITGTTAFDLTTFDGLYSTGWSTSGTYQVTVSAPGYLDEVVEGVVLANGQVTVLNVEMTPFTFSGHVVEEGTNAPIAGAKVNVKDDQSEVVVTTDANGQFVCPPIYAGSHDITAGHWGHHTVCLSTMVENSPGYTVVLPVGYADDFALDLGWTESGDAATGQWERGVPVATEFDNLPCAPGEDMSGDCRDKAYITGNGGGSAGSDDVDDGFTRLESPEFDATGTPDPWVRYYRWWSNVGGMSTPNDALSVQVDNGSGPVTVEQVTVADPGMGTWVMNQFPIADVLTPTATMRFIVYAADDTPGHVVEAGLDRFEVLPASPFLSVPGVAPGMDAALFPDPSDGVFNVLAPGIEGWVRVFDARGGEVGRPVRLVGGAVEIDTRGAPGLYLVRIGSDDGSVKCLRAVVR